MGQNRASKSHLHITLRISRFLQSFQQIKLLKDNSSRQNPLVIVGFLGWPYYISIPSTSNSNFVILHSNNPPFLFGNLFKKKFIYMYTSCISEWYFSFVTQLTPLSVVSCYRIFLILNLLDSTTTSLYTDCSNNLYVGSLQQFVHHIMVKLTANACRKKLHALSSCSFYDCCTLI